MRTAVRREGVSLGKVIVILIAVLAILAAFIMALLAWPGVAHGEGEVSFGIRPTTANADRPETFSFFSHELIPGETIEDAAMVENHGEVAATARVYVADGVTSINGGTSFTHEDTRTHDTASWLTLDADEVTLGPGEEGIVAFTISVPENASPGEHVAGLVVEGVAAEDIAVDDGGFAVQVVKRAGVAVLLEVPGPRDAVLEITDVGLNLQDDQGAVFLVDVRNTGNILLKGDGLLVIKDGKGTELATIPFDMDTVLANDTTSFYVSHPIHLEDGSYAVDATLDYAASRGNEVGATASIEAVAVTVVDGQPEVPKEVGGPDEPPEIITIGGTDEREATALNGTFIIGAVIALVALAAAGAFVWRRTRRRAAQ
jgi:hypothetical protein